MTMRAEIYRQLIGLDFTEEEAWQMSAEFAHAIKSLVAVSRSVSGSLGKALAVSLLHAWVLALLL
jgi:hypothetical protein